jgi:hypothetical protein
MIGESSAVAIARARAAENGWPFSESLSVSFRKGWRKNTGRFEIETNPGMRGTKIRFIIDAATGKIVEEGYIPR